MTADLRARFRFFSENAGYIVGKRAIGALALARAEVEAEARDLKVDWDWDPDEDLSWADDSVMEKIRNGSLQVLSCSVSDPASDEVASLWGIVVSPGDTYSRVVEAELAAELLARVQTEEEEVSYWASRDIETVGRNR